MKRSASILVLVLIFLEWLDFTLYLYLAKSVFALEFFPASSMSVLLSFGLFAAAYFARPVGGWLFGQQADRAGRRMPMIISAALMGLATLGICLLPNYSKIGLWSTWGLLLFRITQGLALGGEINTSAMFLMEHDAKKPLVTGSFIAASCALGMFAGGAIATFLHYFSLLDGWREVFAVAGILSLWVCRLRKNLAESPEFITRPIQQSFNWLMHRQGIINIALTGLFVSATIYICNAFWVSYAIDCQIGSRTFCTALGTLAQLASALFAIPIAYIAKPNQVYVLFKTSIWVAALNAPILFYCTYSHISYGVYTALLGYILGNSLLCASMYYFLYLQLPVEVRCRGVSTIWAIAASIGASSLPLAEYLTGRGFWWFPGLIVSLLAGLAIIGCQPKKTYFVNTCIQTMS